MQIKIKCPNKDCGKTLVVDSEMAGKKGKCSTCDSVFLIPGAPKPGGQPGGSTINLQPPSADGESSEQPVRRKKTKKRTPGQKASGEIDRPKKPRATREELDDYSIDENDYVDYAEDDYESPRRSRRRPAASRRDEDYDDYDDYDAGYEDEEDYDAPRRRGRGRRREDDYDDYDDGYAEDYYEDPYDAPPRGGRGRGGRSRRSGPNFGLIRAAYLIMAIAGCVFCAATGLKILIELIWILSSDIGSTSSTFWKIAELVWMGGAVAVIVSYSFLIIFPNKNNSLGLTIAALSVGAINLIVQMVFKVVPLFDSGRGFLGLGFGSFGFGRSSSMIEPLLKIGFIEGLFIAEMVLVALAMMAFNKQLKDRYNVQSAKQMIIPAGIYGGILIVIGMFFLILQEVKIQSQTAFTIWKWVLYLLRVGGQGMLIWYFISYIFLMFNTRNATPKR